MILNHRCRSIFLISSAKYTSMKRFLSILLISLGFNAQSQSTYWQQEVAYEMEIKMDVEKHQYVGKQKLTYTNHSPDTLGTVFYHLYFNAFQPGSMMDVRSRSIADPDPRVGDRISKLSEEEIGFQKINALKQDGKNLKYRVEGTILEVDLASSILPGQSVVFEMDFEAQVPLQIRRSGRDNKEGIDFSMTQWYPKIAEYDYQGWHSNPYIGREFHGVWGSFDVKITMPSHYTLGATGYLQNNNEIGKGYEDQGAPESVATGDLTWHFNAPKVHDFAWVADPDFTHRSLKMDNGTVLHFLYQADSNTVHWDSLPKYANRVFEEMNKSFGEYPYQQYTVAQGGDGGMEYPMLTLITGKRSKGSLIGVTAHEAIHSWYQHLLATNESQYPWMDEGFTSYAEDVVLQRILPKFKPFAGSYRSYNRLVNSGKIEPLTTHADHYHTNWAYGTASYSMGLIFLRQLEGVVGEATVHQSLKRYFNEWAYKHPTPNDFIRIVEKESGMELDWYLEQWIETSNTIDYGISWMKEVKGESIVQIDRIGKAIMPLDVKVIYKNGNEKWFHIPLRIMRGAKEKEAFMKNLEIRNDWPWVYTSYELKLEGKIAEIESIEIDPLKKMADIDRVNNTYPFDSSKTVKVID